MNCYEILDLFNEVDDCLVLGMYEEQGQGGMPGIRKRMLLLAAVVAITILLMGCAAAVYMWLNQLPQIPDYVVTDYDAEEKIWVTPTVMDIDLVIFGGLMDSAANRAYTEWAEYYAAYTFNNLNVEYNGMHSDVPDNLRDVYQCWNPEMADKLCEIMDTYGLKPSEAVLGLEYWQQDTALELLGIAALSLNNEWVTDEVFGGYIDAPYNFKFEYQLTAFDENRDHANQYMMTETYRHKEYMPRHAVNILDADAYTQWQYTNAQGIPLLMALKSDISGFILAEQPQGYLTIQVSACETGEDTAPLGRRDLERIANNMNLGFTPKAVHAETAQPLLDAATEEYELSVGVAFRSVEDCLLRRYSKGSMLQSYDWEYAWFDLFDDGVPELFIGWGGTYKSFVMIHSDGKVEELYFTPSFFCEDYVYGVVHKNRFYTQYAFYQTDEYFKSSFPVEELVYMDGTWYRDSVLNSDDPSENVISQEEAQAVLDAYAPIELALEWKPLAEFPLSDGDTLGHRQGLQSYQMQK